MDKIFIQDLKIKTLIGIHAWEQQVPQTLLLDVTLAFNHNKAAGSDEISNTINYVHVVEKIHQITDNEHFQLIETLAEKIARLLLSTFAVEQCCIKINKLGVLPNCRALGIEITRKK